MSNLQQSNSLDEIPRLTPQTIPCEWCGGTMGHYGWCDSVKLTDLHAKINRLTKEIETLEELRVLMHEMLDIVKPIHE